MPLAICYKLKSKKPRALSMSVTCHPLFLKELKIMPLKLWIYQQSNWKLKILGGEDGPSPHRQSHTCYTYPSQCLPRELLPHFSTALCKDTNFRKTPGILAFWLTKRHFLSESGHLPCLLRLPIALAVPQKQQYQAIVFGLPRPHYNSIFV